ncbi:oligosaccharyl transferas-like protein subunit [Venturia nashicola]|uniref:Oligosaccharyl transferas-like protein subunit n=1 Tax=Venturia nashicola TaxID=86259 RepID=A0A4Z1PKI4_9PEZI|nr:oligosaccharyl transferas-like protein subunit [Venturia nashicola]TLD35356.1 oligosaccharyl transferas-like protein subunit [Venturia nashicola]
MRASQLLSALLLPLAVLAAKKPTDVFGKANAKSFPIKLDDNKFAELTKAPRDYASIVLLTALEPRYGCIACQEFHPEWQLLSQSWQKGDRSGSTRTVFATLDFTDGKGTFQSLQLQHAPVLLLYHPTSGPNAKVDTNPTRFDFSAGRQTAESIHAWISRTLPEGKKPRVSRPFNYVKAVAVTTAVLGFVSFFAVAAPYLAPLIQNRNLWAAVSLIAVLLFTSGHMFNHIRKVPYVSGNGKGGISYFASGLQNQFGLETQIIAAIYGVLSFATITLAIKVPRIADAKIQGVAVMAWSAVIFLMYSFLLNIFRFKNAGYPFFLPPF